MAKFWKIDDDIRIIPIMLPQTDNGVILSFSDKYPFEIGILRSPDVNSVSFEKSRSAEHFFTYQMKISQTGGLVYIMARSLGDAPSSLAVNIAPERSDDSKMNSDSYSFFNDNKYYIIAFGIVVAVLVAWLMLRKKDSSKEEEVQLEL